MQELDWCIRMLLAAFCGGLIGFERKSKSKNAGIRTHGLIALGSALVMIVSKYGFFDLLSITHANWEIDPSRIAAQVVSGIGFLGAGTILNRHYEVIDGLTTAAGIWVTGAIGLAYGSGLYSIGLIGTAFVLIAEWLGKYFDKFALGRRKRVSWFIQLTGDTDAVQGLVTKLERQYFDGKLEYSIYGFGKNKISFQIFGQLKPEFNVTDVFNSLIADPQVKSAELE